MRSGAALPTPYKDSHMQSAKNAGRLIGALILAQMIGGVSENFALLGPINRPSPEYLVSAAAHANQVSLAVLVELVTGMVTLAIAITAWPHVKRYSQPLALWQLLLATVGLTLVACECATLLSMLSLSQAYTAAHDVDGSLYPALGRVAGAARRWAHYLNLIIGGCGLAVFYTVLCRFALVPRALAAFGIAATLLQIMAVALPLFGNDINFALLLPLGISQLLLALWLLVKGFPQPAAAAPPVD